MRLKAAKTIFLWQICVCVYLANEYYYYYIFILTQGYFFIAFRERDRERGREGGRERNIDAREKHRLVASHMHWDLRSNTRDKGMYLDCESNLQTHWPGQCYYFN